MSAKTTHHTKGKGMIKVITMAAAVMLLVGCASVPMANKAASDQAKRFAVPADGTAGLYIYRDGSFGASLKKDVWVDGECIGESAPNVFFYKAVDGDKEHTISTESEFSPNDLRLVLKAGVNYFVRQYIRLGVFVGGAGLEVVEPSKGERAVKGLDLARSGSCS